MFHSTQVLGRVGKTPEVRYTNSGQAVANFSVAVTEKFKDKEHTTWYDVQCWGRLAEIVGEYVKKGSLVFCDGRMNCRDWEDKDSNKRRSWELVAQTVKFLDGKKSDGEADAGGGSPAHTADAPAFNPDEDDCPF